jgi:hypothetical protein
MPIQKLKGTLKGNPNIRFRIESKILNILKRNTSIQKTPILINSFNRLEYLEIQVDWLLRCGYTNLHIIDNASTYPPLLNYYKRVKAQVYLLDRNVGHEAFWRTHLFQRFGSDYHVLTDSDLLPNDNCPHDFLEYFYHLLGKFNYIDRVGFGLDITDLPDYYPLKDQVLKWEKQFYLSTIEQGVYLANVDTTFSLSRPNMMFQCWGKSIRTAEPFTLRHMPWYENPNNMTQDGKYYINSINSSSSWYKKQFINS